MSSSMDYGTIFRRYGAFETVLHCIGKIRRPFRPFRQSRKILKPTGGEDSTKQMNVAREQRSLADASTQPM
ncbi:hypothetical protein SODALDRAFT_364300 [Sodiomyces alkalinus F11]|uniref:Uncharacterized protein n=1 Tax=Sodiomyces alkalinus (strain CBS 110278 / VKM F-3762 / F11) TaxID=1314773 RepID=A0A3N2PJQ9_SODAK|nr:hypothetical protein SODALDRAFT_364300 [Sodiomyces alkalinus F11]ROT34614.1 hypothetical protein SODALDRAFT_364300 [Sodiomyces alkalinus F11]